MRSRIVIFAFVYTASILSCSAQAAADRTICRVELDEGSFGQGVFSQTFDNSSYCAYLGVRYAEPPVGNLRFRHSVLLEPKGHRNYTSRGSECPQFNRFPTGNKVQGDEDCLFMNIYSPLVAGSAAEAVELYPVLVFVHGGSYAVGWGERDINGVDLLIDSGILVITFNYRIAALGFLKSDERNITGNFGLKDQTTLLRWVQRYIRLFGGDPNQVTFAGQSAGAGSVTHHLYIEQSRDLFHRMIVLSGAMLAAWAFRYERHQCTQKFFDELPFNSLEHLRSTDFRDFFQGDTWMEYSTCFASMNVQCFIPTLESEVEHRDNFTVRSPHESILEAPITQVPILISDTAMEFEGIYGTIQQFTLGGNRPHIRKESVASMVNHSVYAFASKLIAEGKANSSAKVFEQISNTANLHYPTLRLVKDLTRTMDPTVPVYFQRFEFDGRFGKWKYEYYKDMLKDSKYGATHGDDLGYIFSPYNLRQALERPDDFRKEWKVHRMTVELIGNFVKHGNPTPSRSKLSNIIWPAMNRKKSPGLFLNIDESFELRPIADDIFSQHWEPIYDCLYYERCGEMLK